jgi:hypothetical protein
MNWSSHRFWLVLAVSVSVSASINALAQSDPPPQFKVTEEIRTGSIIRKDVAWSSKLPLNRTYAQLTDEQKKSLHDNYESIAPGDEPPYPIEGLKPLVIAITQAQEALRARGELKLIVTVSADGKGKKVEVIGTVDNPKMTDFAGQVMLLTKYKPAVCAGSPCTMQFGFRLKLQVKN